MRSYFKFGMLFILILLPVLFYLFFHAFGENHFSLKIYDLARKGYFIAAKEGDTGPVDFIHSQRFVLVDKEKRIRGYYDGTDKKDVDRLITEIGVLLINNKER